MPRDWPFEILFFQSTVICVSDNWAFLYAQRLAICNTILPKYNYMCFRQLGFSLCPEIGPEVRAASSCLFLSCAKVSGCHDSTLRLSDERAKGSGKGNEKLRKIIIIQIINWFR